MTFSDDSVLVNITSDTTTQDEEIAVVLSLIDQFHKNGEYVSSSSSAQGRHPFNVLSLDPKFPKSIRDKKQMTTLLLKAVAAGHLVKEDYTSKDRKPASRYKVITNIQFEEKERYLTLA
jgi:hypothetical protein